MSCGSRENSITPGCLPRGSTGKKVSVISPTALWGPGKDSQYFARTIAGLALSDGAQPAARGEVFARAAEIAVAARRGEPGTEVGEESKQGYVYRRELNVNKRALITWLAGAGGSCCVAKAPSDPELDGRGCANSPS